MLYFNTDEELLNVISKLNLDLRIIFVEYKYNDRFKLEETKQKVNERRNESALK